MKAIAVSVHLRIYLCELNIPTAGAKLRGDSEAMDEGFIFCDIVGGREVESDGVLHVLSYRED